MATTLTNQATLTYNNGSATRTVSSNIATTTLQEPLTVSKNALATGYQEGDDITYIISFDNSSSSALSNVIIDDNLGTYPIGTTTATPLTYEGPAYLYINGVYQSTLISTSTNDSVSFQIPSLPADANAMILFEAMVNEYAPLDTTGFIHNQVSVMATGFTEPVIAEFSLPASPVADVSIVKSMTPNPVSEGGILTYTFTLLNNGNTPATNVELTDLFQPVPSNITVTLNQTPVAATEYSLVNGTFQFPSTTGTTTITVPAATITQDATTGLVTTTPGQTVITVSGTI